MSLSVKPFEIVEFDRAHLKDLPVAKDKYNLLKLWMLENSEGPRHSALLDGRCVGAGGVAKVQEQWLAWINVSPDLIHYPVAFTKVARNLLKNFQDNYQWEEITAACNDATSEAFAKHFGFTVTNGGLLILRKADG